MHRNNKTNWQAMRQTKWETTMCHHLMIGVGKRASPTTHLTRQSPWSTLDESKPSAPWDKTAGQQITLNPNNKRKQCLSGIPYRNKQQLNNHNKQNTNEIQNVNKQYERTHDLVSSDFVFAPTHKRDQQQTKLQLTAHKQAIQSMCMASKTIAKERQ